MGPNKRLLGDISNIVQRILFLFSYPSDFFLSRKSTRYFLENVLLILVFYYTGLYLLIIKSIQMDKNENKYFILFNIFDLISIISTYLCLLRCVLIGSMVILWFLQHQ